MYGTRFILVSVVASFLTFSSAAEELNIYPSKGQSSEQIEQEQVAICQEQRAQYNRAYSARLEGRGYTVK